MTSAQTRSLPHTRLQELTETIMRLGVKSLSMDEMAKILGISKKTLYERVANKSELINIVLDFVIRQDKAVVADILTESQGAIHEMSLMLEYIGNKMRKLSHSCMHDLRRYYPDEWKVLDDWRRALIYDCITANIRRGQEEGVYRTDLDVDLVASLYRFVVTSITDDTYLIADYTKEEIFREFMKYHLHGICTRAGHQKMKDHGFL